MLTVTMPVPRLGDAVRVEEVPDPQVPERAKRRTYTAKYRAAILAEYDTADRDGRGTLMRREGLYSSLLCEWRKQRDKGALEVIGKSRGRPPADPSRSCSPSVACASGPTSDVLPRVARVR